MCLAVEHDQNHRTPSSKTVNKTGLELHAPAILFSRLSYLELGYRDLKHRANGWVFGAIFGPLLLFLIVAQYGTFPPFLVQTIIAMLIIGNVIESYRTDRLKDRLERYEKAAQPNPV